jgi:hypothetical protein
MKTKACLIGVVYAAIVAFCLPLTAQTMPRTASSPSASPHVTTSTSILPSKQSTRPIPFHGMISAVDRNAKTFTIVGKKASHALKITEKTIITKGANIASLQDIAENEEAGGLYWKNADGTLEAKRLNWGR